MTFSRRFSRACPAFLALSGAFFLAGDAALAQTAPSAAAPTAAAPLIVVDTSKAPEMKPFADKSEAVANEWYPKIVALLGSGPKKELKRIDIVFDPEYKGVAAAAGARIICSPKWFTEHPDDVGAVVHEVAHVVQMYPDYKAPWLVEGIADYVRWFNYEPESKRPRPNPEKATARDSYRTTGAFLDWATKKYDKDLVKKLNTALRDGAYTAETFKTLTGKSLDDLNAEWVTALKAAATTTPAAK